MITIPTSVWGIISVVLACAALGPYLWATIKGTNKPHIFTWIIWTLLTAVAFLIQYLEGAGSGAWSGGVSTVFCLAILIASIKNGEKDIRKIDWIVFGAALLAIPIWLITQNPLWAAIWVTGIDSLGYVPTIRKSWLKPYEEMVTTHLISAFKHIAVLLAVEAISPTTTIYSIGMVVMNGLLVGSIMLSRRFVKLRLKTIS